MIVNQKFIAPSIVHEALFTGFLWANPRLYQKHRVHKMTSETFTSDLWYFYYRIGKEMFENGIREYDDATVYSFLVSRPPEAGQKPFLEQYNGYGGYSIIEEIMSECNKDNKNEEYHLSEIQKYDSLREMQKEGLIDAQNDALVDTYCRMSITKLKSFVQYKQSKIFQNVNHGEVVEYNLLDPDLIQEVIEEMNQGDVMGLPLHEAHRLNSKIKGWRDGTLTYLVLPSGVGKTSIMSEKYLLSLIENEEKGLIFANEENVKKFVRLMLATVATRILGTPINRERMSKGNFDESIKKKLQNAKNWIIKHRPDQIKFFELKRYRLEDIISRIEMYRPLGYKKAIIDTFKPDKNSTDSARWEAFSQNAIDLHDCIKESANDCGTLATVQLKIGKEFRFLDTSVIGKSPEIAEVADTILLARLMYYDEYPERKFELKPYNYKKDELTEDWITVSYTLDTKKEYLIVFIGKCREGGKDEQIIFEANYGINEWKEVAYVVVPRTSNVK